VFVKSSFDALPNCKPWDHAIGLILDAKPVNCKVYPLAHNEQEKLDQFILENLQTGCICPSKSLMDSPVFFIKKKDSSLHIIQLLCPQCDDSQESLPTSSHFGPYQPALWCQVLHKAGCAMGVSEYVNERR